MIGAVISGRLFQATLQMIDAGNPDKKEKRRGIQSFDIFDVKKAPASLEFDLSATAAMPIASVLGQPVSLVATEMARRMMEQEPQETFARLIDQVTANDSGYINFRISNLGLREWTLIMVSTAKSLESRDLGRIVRTIKEISMHDRPPSDQREKIRACAQSCTNLIKSLKSPRIDIENKYELPPIIEPRNESAFLRDYLEQTSHALANSTRETAEQKSIVGIDRDLIVSMGLLVDDLLKAGITKNNEPFAAANVSRICRCAYDLSAAVNNSLSRSAVVDPDSGITSMRVCLFISAGRLLTFVDHFAEFAADKFAATRTSPA